MEEEEVSVAPVDGERDVLKHSTDGHLGKRLALYSDKSKAIPTDSFAIYTISELVKYVCSIPSCGQIVMAATRKLQGIFMILRGSNCAPFFSLCGGTHSNSLWDNKSYDLVLSTEFYSQLAARRIYYY